MIKIAGVAFVAAALFASAASAQDRSIGEASLAAGNILQVSALGGSEGINGAANQFNTGSISSVTNITSGSFGNLTGAATSVGNLTSVSVR